MLLLLGMVAGLILFVGGTIALALLAAQAEKKPDPAPIASTVPTPTPTPTPTPVSVPVPITVPIPEPVEPVIAPPRPGRRLPPELLAKIDRAIEKGVSFLKANPNLGEPGPAFLYGLTLLECGVAANAPPLPEVTRNARQYATNSNADRTYDVSLALLYLDRLGDPADKPLIRKLGLRLIAGQQPCGGWGYVCPVFTQQAEATLLAALISSRPVAAGELALGDGEGRILGVNGRFQKGDSLTPQEIRHLETARDKLARIHQGLRPFPELLDLPYLRSFPAPEANSGRIRAPRINPPDGGDNSNTQFAALGLWAASRHEIPCERALALLAARFRTSQSDSGAWGYSNGNELTPPMTCAGLLALAIGHGIRFGDAEQKRDDPQIHKGLAYLADALKSNPDLPANLYFLWSLERVGVMFNLDKVGEIDWYEWGANHLVTSQTDDGMWNLSNYPGAQGLVNTCFALLFLKKANLVGDLTRKLDRVLDIKRPRHENAP